MLTFCDMEIGLYSHICGLDFGLKMPALSVSYGIFALVLVLLVIVTLCIGLYRQCFLVR